MEVAYGIANEPRYALENRLDPSDQFRSLDQTLKPQPPVGANLNGAFESLLDQLREPISGLLDFDPLHR